MRKCWKYLTIPGKEKVIVKFYACRGVRVYRFEGRPNFARSFQSVVDLNVLDFLKAMFQSMLVSAIGDEVLTAYFSTMGYRIYTPIEYDVRTSELRVFYKEFAFPVELYLGGEKYTGVFWVKNERGINSLLYTRAPWALFRKNSNCRDRADSDGVLRLEVLSLRCKGDDIFRLSLLDEANVLTAPFVDISFFFTPPRLGYLSAK